MATITLVYTARGGLQPVATFAARVASIVLFEGELDLLGMDVVSDTTFGVANSAVRTIVLETNALGDSLWHTAEELIAATRQLYRVALAAKIPAAVIAEEPVVT